MAWHYKKPELSWELRHLRYSNPAVIVDYAERSMEHWIQTIPYSSNLILECLLHEEIPLDDRFRLLQQAVAYEQQHRGIGFWCDEDSPAYLSNWIMEWAAHNPNECKIVVTRILDQTFSMDADYWAGIVHPCISGSRCIDDENWWKYSNIMSMIRTPVAYVSETHWSKLQYFPDALTMLKNMNVPLNVPNEPSTALLQSLVEHYEKHATHQDTLHAFVERWSQTFAKRKQQTAINDGSPWEGPTDVMRNVWTKAVHIVQKENPLAFERMVENPEYKWLFAGMRPPPECTNIWLRQASFDTYKEDYDTWFDVSNIQDVEFEKHLLAMCEKALLDSDAPETFYQAVQQTVESLDTASLATNARWFSHPHIVELWTHRLSDMHQHFKALKYVEILMTRLQEKNTSQAHLHFQDATILLEKHLACAGQNDSTLNIESYVATASWIVRAVEYVSEQTFGIDVNQAYQIATVLYGSNVTPDEIMDTVRQQRQSVEPIPMHGDDLLA
jgi:hypothetical protein